MKTLIRPQGIVIHHSATKDTESLSYDAIRDYHMGVNGWDEVGYHYLIEDVNGAVKVFTGRGIQYVGAHTVGRNNMVGICVVGNYDARKPSAEHIDALVRAIKSVMVLFPYLTVDDIHYHRDTADKTCPGSMFTPVEEIKALVAN